MAWTDFIRRRVARRIARAMRAARTAGPVRTINVSDASNVVVSANVGRSGSVHGASTKQSVRVRQTPDDTDVDTSTDEQRW
jgi:hypothetical protein